MYATLSHSKIKGWSHLSQAELHNTRAIETPNADGSGSVMELLDVEVEHLTYRERAEAILKELGVSPKLRANGVLGFEDIYGASAEYWGEDWRDRAEEIEHDPLIQAILAFAKKRHGKSLVSVSLHLDESYPHVHVISLALVEKEHHRRGRKPKDATKSPAPVRRWSLAARDLRGGPAYMLESAHDAYAAAVEHLGLARGSRGSELTEEERRARKQGRTKLASLKLAEERRAAQQDRLHAGDAWSRAELERQQAEKAKREAQAQIEAAEKAMREARERTAAAARERDSAAADRRAAAADRQAAAKSRRDAEAEKEAAERAKRDAEAEAKVTRDTAARELATAKTDREQAQKARKDATTDRAAAADDRAAAKVEREQAQKAREEAATDRLAAGEERVKAEGLREQAQRASRGVLLAVELWLAGVVDLAGNSGRPDWTFRDAAAAEKFSAAVRAAGRAAWLAVLEVKTRIQRMVDAASEEIAKAVTPDDRRRVALATLTVADCEAIVAAVSEEGRKFAIQQATRKMEAAAAGARETVKTMSAELLAQLRHGDGLGTGR